MNLEPMIEEMYIKMTELLNKVGWERRDPGYFEFNRGSRQNNRGQMTLAEASIVLYPDLLSYHEDGKHITKLWFKSMDAGPITEKAKQAIFKVMKPFKDEDYAGNDFWVNPNYPDGYWTNHVLC